MKNCLIRKTLPIHQFYAKYPQIHLSLITIVTNITYIKQKENIIEVVVIFWTNEEVEIHSSNLEIFNDHFQFKIH